MSTFAGNGEEGYLDGKSEEAKLGQCFGVAIGKDDVVYFSDSSAHVVRKIVGGMVSTFVGRGQHQGRRDGRGEEALFRTPYGLCVDSCGHLLVGDSGNRCLRRVSPDGVVSTVVAEVRFESLYEICVHGEDIYVSDYDGCCVWKISEGSGSSFKLSYPTGVTFFEGSLFTCAVIAHQIMRGESFVPFAGNGERGTKDGALLESSFQYPYGMVATKGGIYVSDRGNNCIRKLTLFVEWSPSIHLETDKWMRDVVRTLMFMRGRGDTLWSLVPREILFVVCSQLHRILWNEQGKISAEGQGEKKQKI